MTGTTRQLNIRVPESIVDELEQMAAEEQVDRTAVVRRLLVEGMRQWRLERALRLYEQGQVTRERAAELAGVSIYEVMDALRERGTSAQYTLGDLHEDLVLLQHRGQES